LIFWKYS